jgi:hypothetical protein
MTVLRLVPFLACALSYSAAAQEIGGGVGASHFSGRFGGAERTSVDSIYLSASAASDKWRLDLTLPYLRVSGGGTVDIGGIIIPIEGLGSSQGLGDLTVRVTRSLPESGAVPVAVSVSAQVKLPTGASGVSTGQTDYAFDLEASKDLGRFSPSVTVGYRVLGDLDFFYLKDGWSLSAGTGVALGDLFFSASYDWSEAATGGPDPRELFFLTAGLIARGWSWNLFASKGLSEGAPDYGVGGGITRSFGKRPARISPRRVPTRT